ncbi:unnamed protein product, partial [Amoebophrya sp. A25]
SSSGSSSTASLPATIPQSSASDNIFGATATLLTDQLYDADASGDRLEDILGTVTSSSTGEEVEL